MYESYASLWSTKLTSSRTGEVKIETNNSTNCTPYVPYLLSSEHDTLPLPITCFYWNKPQSLTRFVHAHELIWKAISSRAMHNCEGQFRRQDAPLTLAYVNPCSTTNAKERYDFKMRKRIRIFTCKNYVKVDYNECHALVSSRFAHGSSPHG